MKQNKLTFVIISFFLLMSPLAFIFTVSGGSIIENDNFSENSINFDRWNEWTSPADYFDWQIVNGRAVPVYTSGIVDNSKTYLSQTTYNPISAEFDFSVDIFKAAAVSATEPKFFVYAESQLVAYGGVYDPWASKYYKEYAGVLDETGTWQRYQTGLISGVDFDKTVRIYRDNIGMIHVTIAGIEVVSGIQTSSITEIQLRFRARYNEDPYNPHLVGVTDQFGFDNFIADDSEISWGNTIFSKQKHPSSTIKVTDFDGRGDVLKFSKYANYHAQLRSQIIPGRTNYEIMVDIFGDNIYSWSWAPVLRLDWKLANINAWIKHESGSYIRYGLNGETSPEEYGKMEQNKWYTMKISVDVQSTYTLIELAIKDQSSGTEWKILDTDAVPISLNENPILTLGTDRTSDYRNEGSWETYYYDNLVIDEQQIILAEVVDSSPAPKGGTNGEGVLGPTVDIKLQTNAGSMDVGIRLKYNMITYGIDGYYVVDSPYGSDNGVETKTIDDEGEIFTFQIPAGIRKLSKDPKEIEDQKWFAFNVGKYEITGIAYSTDNFNTVTEISTSNSDQHPFFIEPARKVFIAALKSYDFEHELTRDTKSLIDYSLEERNINYDVGYDKPFSENFDFVDFETLVLTNQFFFWDQTMEEHKQTLMSEVKNKLGLNNEWEHIARTSLKNNGFDILAGFAIGQHTPDNGGRGLAWGENALLVRPVRSDDRELVASKFLIHELGHLYEVGDPTDLDSSDENGNPRIDTDDTPTKTRYIMDYQLNGLYVNDWLEHWYMKDLTINRILNTRDKFSGYYTYFYPAIFNGETSDLVSYNSQTFSNSPHHNHGDGYMVSNDNSFTGTFGAITKISTSQESYIVRTRAYCSNDYEHRLSIGGIFKIYHSGIGYTNINIIAYLVDYLTITSSYSIVSDAMLLMNSNQGTNGYWYREFNTNVFTTSGDVDQVLIAITDTWGESDDYLEFGLRGLVMYGGPIYIDNC